MRGNRVVFEKILLSSKTIVVVGLSRDPAKDSYSVAEYLKGQGYRIIPVNPAGGEILGEKCCKSLSEIIGPVDIVDVFRPSVECAQITAEALRLNPKMVWLQMGIKNGEAKNLCMEKGVAFVQDLCIKIEHKRLNGH